MDLQRLKERFEAEKEALEQQYFMVCQLIKLCEQKEQWQDKRRS